MDSVTEISDVLQENLQGMRARLSGLENLQILVETNSAMGAVLKNIEDSAKSAEISFQNMSEKLEKNFATLKKVSDTTEKICTLEETNKTALQATVKLLQALGQILKSPAFAKDIEKLRDTAEKVIDKTNLLDDVQKSLSELKTELSTLTEISEEISKQNSGFENFGEVGEKIISSTESMTETFDSMKKEISDLTKKIEAYNGLTKATLDQYSNLTEQDVRILERIVDKLNGN